MATFKVTFHCVLAGSQWGVSFYARDSSARAIVNHELRPAQPLVLAPTLDCLLDCMHPSASINAVSATRVPDEESDVVRRDHVKVKFQPRHGTLAATVGPGAGQIAQPLSSALGINGTLVQDPDGYGGPDITNVSVKLRMFTSTIPTHSRLVDISGVPDAMINREEDTGAPAWSPPMIFALTKLMAAIVARPYFLRYPAPETAFGPFSWHRVRGLNAEPLSDGVNTVVTLRTPHTFTPGMRITIKAPDRASKKKNCGYRGLVGEHVILGVSSFLPNTPTDQIILGVRYRGTSLVETPFNLQLRRLRWLFAPMTGGEIHSQGTRQRGSRDDEGRGRRSKRSCRK